MTIIKGQNYDVFGGILNKSDIDFEKSLEKLEGIVEKLESGELSLEKSLKEFEQGMDLYKKCKKVLDQAEKKITKLSKDLKEEDLG